MTTHWPPTGDVDPETFIPQGVWLPDGREQAGADIETGDRVLIYQSKTGRPEIKNIKRKRVVLRPVQGKEAIIAIAEVIGDLEELRDSVPTKYTFGKDIWWRWHADTRPISMNGFVPRIQVTQILGYKPGYTLRAFGDYKSGLKKLDEDEYNELVRAFKEHPRKVDIVKRAKKKGNWGSHDKGGESQEHRNLKEYVASDPARILGEQGLETVKIEYDFPSGDRADVVFQDADGNIIGAEIEIHIDNNQLVGVLQAIKYRYMLALMEERKYFETRAFLIAKSISKDVVNLCEKYEVECFVIDSGETLSSKEESA
jgi:RecB family endonuclease NucS